MEAGLLILQSDFVIHRAAGSHSHQTPSAHLDCGDAALAPGQRPRAAVPHALHQLAQVRPGESSTTFVQLTGQSGGIMLKSSGEMILRSPGSLCRV